MVDHSAYDLSVQQPANNRMNYEHVNVQEMDKSEYNLPADSEIGMPMRMVSNVFSEHMPDMLVS